MSTHRLKTFGLLAVAVAAVLLPLYGDPRGSPVTHAEWARMLLRALDLEGKAGAQDQASQVFSTLSWKSSLAYRADGYAYGTGVEPLHEAPLGRVVARPHAGEVAYPLTVVRGGEYKLRVRLWGNTVDPVSADITSLGKTAPSGTFLIDPSQAAGWVDAGSTHLDPGAYRASLLLPPGTILEQLEVAPPCLTPIEPVGGWKPTAIAQASDVAVTMLQALNAESELPGAASPPIEIAGSSFQVTEPTAPPSGLGSAAGEEPLALKAGPGGLKALVFVNIPEPGLYSVSVLGEEGGGQSWMADSCRKSVLCGASVGPAANREPGWRNVMTAYFAAGRHPLAVTLANGAVIERVRVERKRDSAADYIATLSRLGFDVGPEGPVTRGRAVDAVRFIQKRRTESPAAACGDVQIPSIATQRADVGSEPVPGPGAAPRPSGPGQPPLGGPSVPTEGPSEPSPSPLPPLPSPVPTPLPSPVTSPTPGPSPRPRPTPTPTPVPTPTPTPPVIPSQPPGSPVLPSPPP